MIWVILIVAAIAGYAYIKNKYNNHEDDSSSYSSTTTTNTTQSLRKMPIPTDAQDVLSCYCEFMQLLDKYMKDINMHYEGEGMLLGGASSSGKGNACFSYTQDIPLQKVFAGWGFNVPVNSDTDCEGWRIAGAEDDYIWFNSKKVEGYNDWIQYDSLKKGGYSDNKIKQNWADSIRDLIVKNWPNAEITRCDTYFTEYGTFSYDVRIKTHS